MGGVCGKRSPPRGLWRPSTGADVVYPAAMDERERRMAQNEALFREVNERVEAVAHQLGPNVPYEFV